METVDQYAKDLQKQMEDEIPAFLNAQLEKLGFGEGDLERLKEEELLKRRLYPDDPDTMCEYVYDGKSILIVRIADNHIRFISPDL